MTFQQLHYFLALCEEQSFTRAAARCGIKQPTLTRAIKDLEAELGGPLFLRGWKATRLSGLGRVVQPYFADIDRSAAGARRAAAGFLAASAIATVKPKENAMRKIVYGGSIAAALMLIAGEAVHSFHPVGTSPPVEAAEITNVYALEAQIDLDALPRYDIPTEAEE